MPSYKNALFSENKTYAHKKNYFNLLKEGVNKSLYQSKIHKKVSRIDTDTYYPIIVAANIRKKRISKQI